MSVDLKRVERTKWKADDDAMTWRAEVTPGPPAGRFDAYHTSIRELVARASEVSFRCGDAERDLCIELPPLGDDGLPDRGAYTDFYGGVWIFLSSGVDGDGFVVEMNHGAVVHHAASSRRLTYIAPTLDAWLAQWLEIDSGDAIAYPEEGGANVAISLAQARPSLRDAVADVPEDWELLSFEHANPRDFFDMDSSGEPRKLEGHLAWMRPPRERGFFARVFGL